MTRLLTVLFCLLLGAVVVFRLQPDADREIGAQARAKEQRLTASQRQRVEHPALKVRSLGKGLPELGEWRGKPVLRDLNGDGKTDIVCSIRRFDKFKIADGIHVFLGDGAGGWTPCDQGLSKDMGYGGADAADLNGDGRPDLVYSGHDLPPRVFLNFLGYQGQNEWVGLDHIADLDGVSCSDVALGDFDRDGFPDLAVMGFFPKTGGLHVMSNQGTGEWKPRQELMPARDYGAIVRFRDLDGDGNVELIAATAVGAKTWKYGEAEWIDQSEGLPTTIGVGEISGIVRGIDARDIDGDGRAELAVSGLPNASHAPVSLYRREGDRWAAWGRGLPSGESFFDVVFARVGGAVCMFLAGQQGVVVVRCAADGACEVLGRIEGTRGVLNVGAGDIDGDGSDEVLVVMQKGLRLFAIDAPGSPDK